MPIELAELELDDGTRCRPAPVRYPAVRLLVRRRGAPLGYLDLPNTEEALDPHRVATAVAQTFAQDLVPGLAPAERAQPREAALVSVVVCTRDRPELLRHCLDALARQDHPRYEVVVVDNAPRTSPVRELAAQHGARYVVEPCPGLDRARNRGLAEARGAIVAYADDDTRPDPRWVSSLARGFTSPDVAAVTGLVVPSELETHAQWLFEDIYGGMEKGFRPQLHTRRGRSLAVFPHALGVGCNMAFRRDALVALGGFDPAFDVGTFTGGAGDLDVFQRLIEADAVVAYRPDAVVAHLHRRTVKQLRRQLFDNGRGFGSMLLAAFARARGRDRLAVGAASLHWFVSWHLARIARRLMRREQLPLLLILAETLGFLLAPAYLGAARVQAARRTARRR